MRRATILTVLVLFIPVFVPQVSGGTTLVINSALFDVTDEYMTLHGVNFESLGDLEVWIGDICLTCSLLPNCISISDDTIECNLGGTPPATQGGTWIVRVSACNAPHCKAEIHLAIPTGGMSCNTGDFVECYTGEQGTSGVGECVPGVRSCTDGDWGDCEGEITPASELDYCDDGRDNDCNGLVDCDDPGCFDAPVCNCSDSDEDGWSFGTGCTGEQDCNDENPDVHPGQETFFWESYIDPETGGESWDYNCDENEEKKHTDVVEGFELVEDFAGYWTCYVQTGSSPYCTATSTGWWPEVADCGQDGHFFYPYQNSNSIGFPGDGDCNPPARICDYAYGYQVCR